MTTPFYLNTPFYTAQRIQYLVARNQAWPRTRRYPTYTLVQHYAQLMRNDGLTSYTGKVDIHDDHVNFEFMVGPLCIVYKLRADGDRKSTPWTWIQYDRERSPVNLKEMQHAVDLACDITDILRDEFREFTQLKPEAFAAYFRDVATELLERSPAPTSTTPTPQQDPS